MGKDSCRFLLNLWKKRKNQKIFTNFNIEILYKPLQIRYTTNTNRTSLEKGWDMESTERGKGERYESDRNCAKN